MKKIIIPVLILLIPIIIISYIKIIYLFSGLLIEDEHDRIFATIFSTLLVSLIGGLYLVERDNDSCL